jgi:hypothetical protein
MMKIYQMNLHSIKLGTWLKWLINIITLGTGKYISTWIAVDILGFQSCGCCEREQWLNRLTNKEFDGRCNEIRLW